MNFDTAIVYPLNSIKKNLSGFLVLVVIFWGGIFPLLMIKNL